MTTIQLYVAERTYLFAAVLLSNSPFHLVCCNAIQIKTIGKNVDFFCKMHDKLLVKEKACVVLAGRARKKRTCLPGAVNFNCSWAGKNRNLVVRPSGHENVVSVILL